MNLVKIYLVSAILFISFTGLNAATMVFSDTDFSTGWSVTTPTNGQVSSTISARTDNSGGSAQFLSATTGGNPGSYAMLRLEINPSYRIIEAFYAAPGAIFSPASQGALNTLSFQFDTRKSEPLNSGNAQAFGPALMQGSIAYYRYYANTIEAWQTIVDNNLTSMDFQPFYGHGLIPTDPSYRPDFSLSGAPIQFGHYRGNSTTFSSASVTGDLDNWSATINYTAVPEPGSAVLLSLGFLFIASRRIK